jgi:hypothetical protein
MKRNIILLNFYLFICCAISLSLSAHWYHAIPEPAVAYDTGSSYLTSLMGSSKAAVKISSSEDHDVSG